MCAIAESIMPTSYGKFGDGKGVLPNLSIGISPRLGWWLMEAPCTFVFAHQFFVRGKLIASTGNTLILFYFFIVGIRSTTGYYILGWHLECEAPCNFIPIIIC